MTKAEISIYVGRAKREMRAAEEMLKSTLESRMSVLGPAHEDTLKSMNALASCFYEAGDYASAEPLYRQALASGKAALGDTHQVTLSSMNNLVSSELTAALDLESHNPEPPVSFAATELHPRLFIGRATCCTARVCARSEARSTSPTRSSSQPVPCPVSSTSPPIARRAPRR